MLHGVTCPCDTQTIRHTRQVSGSAHETETGSFQRRSRGPDTLLMKLDALLDTRHRIADWRSFYWQASTSQSFNKDGSHRPPNNNISKAITATPFDQKILTHTKMSRRGIEPRYFAWKANILPLNHLPDAKHAPRTIYIQLKAYRPWLFEYSPQGPSLFSSSFPNLMRCSRVESSNQLVLGHAFLMDMPSGWTSNTCLQPHQSGSYRPEPWKGK